METNKNKNGPLNVIRLYMLSEQDYRGLNALSYSRLSDIEKIGVPAVNALPGDKNNARGLSVGSIVDDVISRRLEKIPTNIHSVSKIPGQNSITGKISNAIAKEMKFNSFSDLTEKEIIDFVDSKGFFMNGINRGNLHQRISNFSQFINVRKSGIEEENILTEFDYKIAKKAIDRIRKSISLRESAPKERFNKGRQNEFHTEYQVMLLATINGIEFKCMLDAIVYNHATMTIYPIDIKTGIVAENNLDLFFEENYCFYNYYIQSGMYKTILSEYFKYQEEYKRYTIADFQFVYSTTNPKLAFTVHDPFFFNVSKKWHLESFKGFKSSSALTNKVNTPFKKGIVELFNIYKDNVINPPKREDLIKAINDIQEEQLPF